MGWAAASGLQRTVKNTHFRNPPVLCLGTWGSFTSCNSIQTTDMTKLEKKMCIRERVKMRFLTFGGCLLHVLWLKEGAPPLPPPGCPVRSCL